MGIFGFLGKALDKGSVLLKVAVFVLGTKDKTALNKISEKVDKLKQAKDALTQPRE